MERWKEKIVEILSIPWSEDGTGASGASEALHTSKKKGQPSIVKVRTLRVSIDENERQLLFRRFYQRTKFTDKGLGFPRL